MKLNLKDWKKVSSDDSHSVLRNSSGHELKIIHKPLTRAMRSQLDGLPMVEKAPAEGKGAAHTQAPQKMAHGGSVKPVKMAGGGDVVGPMPVDPNAVLQDKMQAFDTQLPPVNPGYAPENRQQLVEDKALNQLLAEKQSAEAAAALKQQTMAETLARDQARDSEINAKRAALGLPHGVIQPTAIQPSTQAPPADATAALPTTAISQAPAGSPDPYGYQAQADTFQAGMAHQAEGLANEALAVERQGQQQAAMLKEQIKVQQAQAKSFQDNLKALNAERQQLMQGLQDTKVDPTRYLSSMGTADKISTAVGLIMSGWGAGMSGQEPMAIKFLQNQVDNDIKAQVAELGKKENLLSANLRQYGNLKDAMTMTHIMQNDMIANKMKIAASEAQGPVAKARLLQAIGELEQKNAPMIQQMAMRRSLTQGLTAGRVAPEQVIRMMVPQGEQGAMYKELKEAQETNKFKESLFGAFDKLAEINTVGNRTMSPIQSARQVKAVREPLTAQLSKNTAGRFTEQDAHMLDTVWPAPGDTDATLKEKRIRLAKLATEKMNFPMLKAWGIDVSGGGKYDHTGTSRIKESAPILPK